ncbi:hypothetical protein HanIR_Chr02g0059061 [Helianthus annuus]|nr:hypothetical protein HanIR_Chr02g0059061 [Helianthus annuus]
MRIYLAKSGSSKNIAYVEAWLSSFIKLKTSTNIKMLLTVHMQHILPTTD